jgi:pimeloyl-ACP methyl ester carboxylesterase
MSAEAGVADEFSSLREASDDAGLEWRGQPSVARREIAVAGGRSVSALVWGDAPSQMVLLHGGAQNAHTWDTVALAVREPLAAVDLPGHGHSSWRPDADYSPSAMAGDVVVAVAALAAARGCVLVGMGLGAPVAIRIAVDRPDLVRRLVFVDSASGVPFDEEDRRRSEAGAQVAEFTSQARFASFDELLARTVRYNPRRSEASLRRGAAHNSIPLANGTWTWRWDPAIKGARILDDPDRVDLTHDKLAAPVLVVRGELSDAVTDDAVATLVSLHPDTRLVTLTGAGHGVQGDRPRELAYLLRAEMEIAIGEED